MVGIGFGVIATVRITPVPLSATGDPVTVALVPVIVAVPLAAPAAVGLNRTLMVQVAAAASVAVQLPPLRLKGAVTATAMPVKAPVPVLCSVKV
jgi:hypothetical protein